MGAVRTIKRCLIQIIASHSSVLFGRYLASKLVIFPAKKLKFSDFLSDQIRCARDFDIQTVENYDPVWKTLFQARGDVLWMPYHVQMPLPDDFEDISQDIFEQFYRWVKAIGCREAQSSLLGIVCQQFVCFPPIPTLKSSIIDEVRNAAEGKILVPLDRDTKRRACMLQEGYLYRLYLGYVCDEQY